MTDATFCIYCGMFPTDADWEDGCFQADGNFDSEHTLGYDVVMRDGHRGQYLTPTMVGDMEDLGVNVPAEVKQAAEAWLGSQYPSLTEPTESEVELVTDFTMYDGESQLSDLGYTVVWEDGYVIYKLADTAEDELASYEAMREGLAEDR